MHTRSAVGSTGARRKHCAGHDCASTRWRYKASRGIPYVHAVNRRPET